MLASFMIIWWKYRRLKKPANVIFVFKCGNEKCNAVVPTNSLNLVKLKLVHRGPVECKKCGKRTKWQETAQLIVQKKEQEEVEI